MSVAQPRTSWAPNDLVSVKNEEATTLAKGVIVKRGATQDGVLLPTDNALPILGVVREAIPAGEWGTVQLRGMAAVLAGGAIAIGDSIEPVNATGRGVLWASAGGTNTAMVGKANSVAADGELFECELAGPGVVVQG